MSCVTGGNRRENLRSLLSPAMRPLSASLTADISNFKGVVLRLRQVILLSRSNAAVARVGRHNVEAQILAAGADCFLISSRKAPERVAPFSWSLGDIEANTDSRSIFAKPGPSTTVTSDHTELSIGSPAVASPNRYICPSNIAARGLPRRTPWRSLEAPDLHANRFPRASSPPPRNSASPPSHIVR